MSLITITGKFGIKATVLAYSISKAGKKFITWEIEYPRLVLAELNTHRQMSKNSFSSRAVPFAKMVSQLNGRPVRFGANQAGMQDQGVDFDAMVEIPAYLFGPLQQYMDTFLEGIIDVRDLQNVEGKVHITAEHAWNLHKFISIGVAGAMNDAKYHKQVFNRLTEAHQMMKTVISATETDNFFWLRDHDAADPTLHELARVMKEAMDASTPEVLEPGEWHLPYIDVWRDKDGKQCYGIDAEAEIHVTLEEAIKVSCARCAAVSYRNEGYGLEKSIEVYDRLVGDERKHASAFEHCATPMSEHIYEHGFSMDYELNAPFEPSTWEEGITHVDRSGKLWSGNLQGFIQYRKLIPGENYVAEDA